MFTKVKTPAEIEAMREAGKMLATVLNFLAPRVVPGISTKELANMAASELKKLGGEPAFLGYYGFPDVLCVSVNDEVVHGIPRDDHIIMEGDITSLDFGVKIRGMITDAAISIIAGNGRAEDKKLVETTQASLSKGIKAMKPGRHVGAISAAIQSVLEPAGYGIVRDFVGHGVGHELHEEPNVPNYGSAQDGPELIEGMTLAIEPMATLGNERVFIASDQWTVKTLDGSRSAHFEHTVLITKDGAEILTTI
jgi:methionyl aminopeptidase